MPLSTNKTETNTDPVVMQANESQLKPTESEAEPAIDHPELDEDFKKNCASIDLNPVGITYREIFNRFNQICRDLHPKDPPTEKIAKEVYTPEEQDRKRKALEYFRFFYNSNPEPDIEQDLSLHSLTLELPLGPSESAVKKKYRELARKIHPDVQGSDCAPSQDHMQAVTNAYDAFMEYFRKPKTKAGLCIDELEEMRKKQIEEAAAKWKKLRENAIAFSNYYFDHPFTLQTRESYEANLLAQRTSLIAFYEKLKIDAPEMAEFFQATFETDAFPSPSLEQCKQGTDGYFQPTPLFIFMTLKQMIERGRLNLKRDFVINAFRRQTNLYGFKQQAKDPYLCARLYLMPEFFGDDFNAKVADLQEREDEQTMNERAPNLYRFMSPAYQFYQLANENKVSGIRAIPWHYIRLYIDRMDDGVLDTEIKKITNPKLHLNQQFDNTFCERITVSLMTALIKEHQKIIAEISYENPHQLISFDPKANDEKGQWIVNPRACDPLLARMYYINLFMSKCMPERRTKFLSFGQSLARKYMRELNRTVIRPIYVIIKDLGKKEVKSAEERARLQQLQLLLICMIEEFSKILLPHFTVVHGCTLAQNIRDALSLDRPAALEKIAALKEQDLLPEVEQLMFRQLHATSMKLLTQCITQGEYYAIIDITVSAKDDFQAALRADKDFVLRIKENEESSVQITPAPVTISVQEEDAAINVILPATEQQTSVKQQAPVIEPATTATPITLQPDPEKRESDQEIYERVKSILREHKQLEPKQVQDKIDNILTELNQLELKQKNNQEFSYQELTQQVTQINVALKNQNRIQASVDLHQQAQKAQGKPHLGWKIFGAAVMALGVALIVAGVLLKTGIIDLLTFMPTSIAGPTVYAIGGTLCAAGCGFFYHGKQRGLSKSIDDLADRVRMTPN